MKSKTRKIHPNPWACALRRTATATAVAACFSAGAALANPTAPTVVNGSASFAQAGNILNITNSPNAIINWGSFSIGVNELTRFIQQSGSSAVLNRVIGQDPSAILGALQSNGRVFLVNPNGIVFGAGAQINVAGLVASTLNLSNDDFLNNRMKFTDGAGAGNVVNQGNITGGSVYLIGKAVTNDGLITSANGEVLLAAGNSVELVNPGTPNLRVEIVAADNAAKNLGTITAEAGRIGIYAGLISNSGTLNASSAVAEGGKILLKASRNATLDTGSQTTANGTSGGSVEIQSGDTTRVSGTVEAKGSAGNGGTVHVLGHQVGLLGAANIDVSGQRGGGTALIGGDYQGGNPDIRNAFRTYVSADAGIKANAVEQGNGGKVIVWADDVTRFYGSIAARGGAIGGNGGFAEVSGKGYLDYRGIADLRAPGGLVGSLLLDPSDINIIAAYGGDTLAGGGFSGGEFGGATGLATIAWDTIENQLGLGNLAITTSGSGGSGNITVQDGHFYSSNNNLSLVAHNNLTVDAGASISNAGNGGILMYAGWNGSPGPGYGVLTGVGDININANVQSGGQLLFHAGKNINVTNASIISSGTPGILLDSVAGSITLVGSTISATNSSGNASATMIASAGGISLTNSGINAVSSNGYDTAVSLTAATGIVIDGSEGSYSVRALAVGGCCGDASLSMTTTGAGANIRLTNAAKIQADGGERVLVTLNAMNGTIQQLDNASYIKATAIGSLFAPIVNLTAVNGIGTLANPVRLDMVGDPTINFANTGTSGDIALSFFTSGSWPGLTGGIHIEEDVIGTYNNNPNGTYFIKVEGGNFTLEAPFLPGASSSAPLLPGQSVVIEAAGDIVLKTGSFGAGAINASGTGNVTLRSTLGGGLIDLQAGSTVSGKDVYLTADNMKIDGIVTGGPFTTILPFTTSRGIDLGGVACEPNCTTLSLTQAELDNILGGGMVIGSSFGGSGDLTFVGNVSPSPSFLNLGGTNILQTGGVISAPLSLNASGNIILTQPGNQIPSISTGSIVGGNIQIVNAGDLAIAGTVHANGSVNLMSTSGAIIDSNTNGFDIIAPQIMLNGAAGVGALSNPIETQTSSLTVTAGANEIGILNSGNLTLAGLTFSGSTASVGTTGNMGVNGIINASGNLALLANNGMTVNQNISASGALLLNAGFGDLVLDDVTVMSGGGLQLTGNHVTLVYDAFAASTAGVLVNAAGNLTVQDSQLGGGAGYGLTSITTGGNVIVNRGLIVGDPDVMLKVGGVINIDGTLSQQGAIHAISPNSVNINFPNSTSGGFFVSGTPNLIYDPATNTGFFVGNPPVPAALGAGLVVTYGTDGGGIVLPSTVEQTIFGTLITALGESTKSPDPDKNKDIFKEEEKKKDAPVCR
jgi:filamentous hemagglutinin family protein